MIQNTKYKIVKTIRTIAITLGRQFFIILIAVFLLAGVERETYGQTESIPNAYTLAAKETLEDPHTKDVDRSESASSQLSASEQDLPSPAVAAWVERFEKLANGIQTEQLDQKSADNFYQELNVFLTETRNQIRDTLKGLVAPVPQPARVSLEKDPTHPPEEQTESESSTGAPPSEKAPAEPERVFVKAEQLLLDLNVLFSLRIQALKLVSPELRDRITGTGFKGVQTLKEELDYLFIRVRYHIDLVPQIGKQALKNNLGAPIPAISAFIQFILLILVLIWWRRWAAQGLAQVRSNILNIRPLKPNHKRLARFLWYLNRVRRPIEWYLFFAIIWQITGPHESIFHILVWTQFKYVLLTWFVVNLVDAVAARRTAGLKSETVRLKLRSIWLITLWILFVSMGVEITQDLTGQGAIHAWFWTLSKILAVPVVFLMIHWWRQEIYRELEDESEQPTYIKKVLQNKRGLGSYLGAAVGAVYLIGDMIRQRLLRGITAFELGRHLVANLTRIKAIRISERQQQQHHYNPIPQEMRDRLYRCEGRLVESVGLDILERMIHLVQHKRRGNALIVSERGGGKSQLLERLDDRLGKTMVLFDCPPGGLDAFYQELAIALDLNASDLTPEVLTKRIKDRGAQAIGIDNLHRLSRPALGGQHEIDRLAGLIWSLEADVFWFYGFDWAAWQYISRVRADRLFVDDVLNLPLWTEDQIRELTEQRSIQAEIQPEFGELSLPRQFVDTDYETVEERNRFGFYRILWNASEGNPAVALQLWADSLRISPDGRTLVSLPKVPATEELEKVNITVLLALRVLVQSGYSNQEQITDSLKLPETEVKVALRFALLREWVELTDGWYRVTWKWFRTITRVLARQNFLVRRTLGGS